VFAFSAFIVSKDTANTSYNQLPCKSINYLSKPTYYFSLGI